MDCIFEKPIVFWALNHKLEKEEITFQLEEMASNGVGGAILHPRSGLLTPYLSDEYFEMIGWMIKEAERIGIDVWLYDEDPYPSGVAGGKVLAEHPEYRAQTMQFIKKEYNGNTQVFIEFPLNKIVGAYAIRKDGNQIAEKIDLMPYIGLLRTEWRNERKYCTYYPTTYTKAKPQNRSDTYIPYYALEWTTPPGDWTVLVCYTEIVKDFWLYPSYVDQLNPDTIKYFIETTYEPYRQRFSSYFGNVIKGFFVDEPKYLSDPYPWTNKLPEIFQRDHGYTFEDALIALLTDAEDSEKKRCDYWETVQNLFLRTFPQQVRAWCDENNLLLIGHCSPEEEPVDQVRYTGSISYFMRSMSIPGTDFITNQIGGSKYPILALSPILTASTSRQFSNGLALCETYGVSEWQLRHSDIISIANWLFTHGINIFIFHVFMYSMDGYRKKDAGPSEFYQNPSWKFFNTLSEYMQRVSLFFNKNIPSINTAFYYPFSSWMSLFGIHHDGAFLIRDEFTFLMHELISSHWQFDFVNDKDFEQAGIQNGTLIVGNASYSKIIVPPLHYLPEASRLTLERCREAGIELLLFTADEPFHINLDFLNTPVHRLSGSAEQGFTVDLPQNTAEPVTISGEKERDIVLCSTSNGHRKSHWLYNPLAVPAEIDFSLLSECKFTDIWYPSNNRHLWHAGCSGHICIPGGTAIVLSESDDRIGLAAEIYASRKVWKELSGEWQFTTEKPNLLRLDDFVLEPKNDLGVDHIDFEKQLTLAHSGELGSYLPQFHPGTYWYKTVIDIDDYSGPLYLMKGMSSTSSKWNIFVNGQAVQTWQRSHEYDCMEYSADISPYICSPDRRLYRRGELTITIEITAENKSDGLLEPLYLTGRFTVDLNNAESIGAELHVKAVDTVYTGSWAEQGYPHYSGSAVYQQRFDLDGLNPDSRYYLYAYAAGNPVQAELNGHSLGTVNCAPYEFEVTESIKTGANTLTLITANTPDNMLYNLHSPSGLTKPVLILEADHSADGGECKG